jgi:phage-related minor tail protein
MTSSDLVLGESAQIISDLPFLTRDLESTKSLLAQIDAAAGSATKTLSTGLASAIVNGKSLDATLAAIVRSLGSLGVSAGAGLLSQGVASGVGALLSGVLGGIGGGVSIAPFAEGGVVARPTFFGAGSSIGLMGERGAEAIMPLARGPDGALGVKMQGESRPMSVTVNVAAQDVESFRRSEGQIQAALARAVARGRRSL